MLTANCMYSHINSENLPLPTQIKLSGKPSIFCCIIFAFLESKLNIQCFEKKQSLIGQVFMKLLGPTDVVL